ncbi:MAG: N-acetylmuramoyl-L-alanine amidase [Candidatus Coprovivens sp.]
MNKKVIASSLVILAGLQLGEMVQANDKPKILLDLAHLDTIEDNGASYLYWNEREMVNKITDKVAIELVNRGYSVTLTRDYDTPISINDRVALANRTDYDYYISIHGNSCETPNTGTGVEAYYNGKMAEIMADAMLKNLEELGYVNRGNYETPYYTYYIHDSVLLELGFVNNWKDRKMLFENEDTIVQLIVDSIDSACKMSQ